MWWPKGWHLQARLQGHLHRTSCVKLPQHMAPESVLVRQETDINSGLPSLSTYCLPSMEQLSGYLGSLLSLTGGPKVTQPVSGAGLTPRCQIPESVLFKAGPDSPFPWPDLRAPSVPSWLPGPCRGGAWPKAGHPAWSPKDAEPREAVPKAVVTMHLHLVTWLTPGAERHPPCPPCCSPPSRGHLSVRNPFLASSLVTVRQGHSCLIPSFQPNRAWS